MFLIWIIPSAVAQNAETMIVVGLFSDISLMGSSTSNGRISRSVFSMVLPEARFSVLLGGL
jgi:hypothetical protein